MRVPRHVIEARRLRLENLLATHRYLPIQDVCKKLGISEATARRDLEALAQQGRLTRTHGGALLEFNERFPSFAERQKRAASSKEELARAALGVIAAGQTVFLDSGTTVAALAAALAAAPREPLRVLTVNLPAAEILSGCCGVEVHLTGGQMFQRQSVLLGEAVVRSIERWRFDVAFLSAEGMDAEGLWNSQLEIVAHQHAVVRRALHHVFILDRGKIGRRAAHFLLPWAAVDHLLTDASPARVASEAPAAARLLWEPRLPAPFRLDAEGAAGEIPVHFL
ncbi:MAG: DeoR/GlpR family DNA-binding transcription regulator [Terrimicrobiaceae bacterium]|nr:DeoR/GlpR family DNA-binding transcription regulator [Terrimicrobiaceae bacterium]